MCTFYITPLSLGLIPSACLDTVYVLVRVYLLHIVIEYDVLPVIPHSHGGAGGLTTNVICVLSHSLQHQPRDVYGDQHRSPRTKRSSIEERGPGQGFMEQIPSHCHREDDNKEDKRLKYDNILHFLHHFSISVLLTQYEMSMVTDSNIFMLDIPISDVKCVGQIKCIFKCIESIFNWINTFVVLITTHLLHTVCDCGVFT